MQEFHFQAANLLALAGFAPIQSEASDQCLDSPFLEEQELLNIETYYRDDGSSTRSPTQSSIGKIKSSKFHNKLTQTVTTFKQIMEPYYKDLGSTKISRKIISTVWARYTKRANPSKRSLKLMFNGSPNMSSFQNDRLLLKQESFSQAQLTIAMNELKQGIIYHCSMTNVRLNLNERQKIVSKDILEAYIQRFLKVQLSQGQIKERFGEKGAHMIYQIMRSEKKEEDFVSAVMF